MLAAIPPSVVPGGAVVKRRMHLTTSRCWAIYQCHASDLGSVKGLLARRVSLYVLGKRIARNECNSGHSELPYQLSLGGIKHQEFGRIFSAISTLFRRKMLLPP